MTTKFNVQVIHILSYVYARDTPIFAKYDNPQTTFMYF